MSNFFNSSTRYLLTTTNSPIMFDLTYMLLYIASIQGKQPAIFEIVAVGAIAIVFELRIPYCFTCSRTGIQSIIDERVTSTGIPLSFSNKSNVSIGKIFLSHFEPL